MRIPTGILMIVLFGISGCLSAITDPLDRRGHFEDTQERFTQYVRWGKFEEASRFVDPGMRERFMSCSPELSDLRFSDYEITRVDIRDGVTSASVDVRYTGYRLSMPIERSVDLTEEWTRDEATGLWTVKLDIEKLRDTMIGGAP
jgi:hypothetical protein